MDTRLTIWIATHRWGPIDWLFIGLGWIEKLGAVWIVLALAFAFKSGAVRAVGFAILVGFVTFLADSATFGVKDVVDRPRPFVSHPQIHPLYVVHSSSFPAGHAATAFAGATLLSWVARRWTAGFALLAAAVGFSRVYVGDHYVGDVLGGAAIGLAVGLAAIFVLTRISAADRLLPGDAGSGSRPSRSRARRRRRSR